jgi:probable HAF family extracellular repeat protein
MNSISKSVLALSSSIVTALWSSCSVAQIYTVTEIPSLGGHTFGYAVNDSGQVTGYSYLSASGTGNDLRHAYIFSNGVMTDIGALPGFTSSSGQGINASGAVTGSSSTTGTNQHAFLYSNGDMQDLGTQSGYVSSWGSGINDSGQITGTLATSGNATTHAFFYSNGVMQDLGTLGGTGSEAAAINDSGQVTGTSYLSGDSVSHAFLYSNGVMQDLGSLGGTSSGATAMNSSGQVTGQSSTASGAEDAFLYNDGLMQDLGQLGDSTSNESAGLGIDASGDIVGYGYPIGNTAHALLYTNGQWFDLNKLIAANDPLRGHITLFFAFGISNNGNITAVGRNLGVSPRIYRTFLLTPGAPFMTPVITGALGQNGWYIGKPTTLKWTVPQLPVAPTESGCGSVNVPDTTGTTYTCSAANQYGTASDSVIIRKDTVAPKVVIKKPASNATYTPNQNVLASYTCADATSGVATCVGTVADGASINTSSLGQQTFAVTGSDNAGNAITKTVLYTVEQATEPHGAALKSSTAFTVLP